MADSDEDLDVLSGTRQIGGFALAGTVSVNRMETTTEAIVQNGSRASLFNQDSRYQLGGAFAPNSTQTIRIEANDTANLDGITGTLAGGGAGFGASVDVGSVRNRTVAIIGVQTRMNAVGDVSLLSNGDKSLYSDVVAFAGGAVGLSGAVSVQSLGKPAQGFANDEFDRTARRVCGFRMRLAHP